MLVASRILCVWPGLARLWTRGDWPSLILALSFAVLLNLALVTSFLWPEILGKGFPTIIWPVLGIVWLISALDSHRLLRLREINPQKRDDTASPVPDTLFNQAQKEYLKGNWSEAEQLLKRRLQFRARDIEARLLLSTLCRRRGLLDLAESELKTLLRFDESQPWQDEIRIEQALLSRSRMESESDDVAAKGEVELRESDSPAEPLPAEGSRREFAKPEFKEFPKLGDAEQPPRRAA